jgi:hypothetical protein
MAPPLLPVFITKVVLIQKITFCSSILRSSYCGGRAAEDGRAISDHRLSAKDIKNKVLADC